VEVVRYSEMSANANQPHFSEIVPFCCNRFQHFNITSWDRLIKSIFSSYYNTLKKSIPIRGRGGPLVCETSRLPHFLDNRLTDGGEVEPYALAALYPQEDSWYSFLLEAASTPGPQCVKTSTVEEID
jgi:hypothetical protein